MLPVHLGIRRFLAGNREIIAGEVGTPALGSLGHSIIPVSCVCWSGAFLLTPSFLPSSLSPSLSSSLLLFFFFLNLHSLDLYPKNLPSPFLARCLLQTPPETLSLFFDLPYREKQGGRESFGYSWIH